MADPESISDTPMLSRSGRSDPGGKLDSRLDVPVSQDLEEAIITLATLAGVPKAEYVRMVLTSHVFGELGMAQRMARHGSARPWDQSPSNRG